MEKNNVFIEVPQALLPDIVEMLTGAYTDLRNDLTKKEKRISDLQFDNAKLRNRNEFLEKDNRSLHQIMEGECPPIGAKEVGNDF